MDCCTPQLELVKLDKETGLAAEAGVGTCLARRPKFMDTAVEGPYIRYHKWIAAHPS